MKYLVSFGYPSTGYIDFIFADKADALDFMEQAVMAYMPDDDRAEISISMKIVFTKEKEQRG